MFTIWGIDDADEICRDHQLLFKYYSIIVYAKLRISSALYGASDMAFQKLISWRSQLAEGDHT